jgi:hypothetical protein
MDSAEVLTSALDGLPAEYEPLILRQLAEALTDRPELVARDRRSFRFGASIRQVQRMLRAAQRNCRLQRRRHRAATGDSSTAILDPGKKTLLQGIADMRAARESAPTSREDHELQSGLPIAVLQVLPAQSVAMDPQQQLPLPSSDDRHRLGRIPAASGTSLERASEARRSLFSGKSGRHTCMSSPEPPRPPLQLR